MEFLLLRFELMNPNVLLDSTRNAFMYFFQSLFPLPSGLFVCLDLFNHLWHHCFLFIFVLSDNGLLLVNFTAHGLFEFITKCTSLFGQTLYNQASTYAYFSCYCYQEPGIKGNVCACWGSFPRAGFHFMSMLYISFHELPVDVGWNYCNLFWLTS